MGLKVYHVKQKTIEFSNTTEIENTPFKKSNATRLWLIIFLLSWIFIHQVWYPQKACLFAFRIMPCLLGLFHWGACRVSKLGVKSKRKSCKIYQIVWEMHVICQVLGCMHAYPLPIHCTEILRNFGALNGQWVPTRAFIHKRKARNIT